MWRLLCSACQLLFPFLVFPSNSGFPLISGHPPFFHSNSLSCSPYLTASWDFLLPSLIRHSELASTLAWMLPSPDLYLPLVWATLSLSHPTIHSRLPPASHWPAGLWPLVRRDGCVVRGVRPTSVLQGHSPPVPWVVLFRPEGDFHPLPHSGFPIAGSGGAVPPFH